MELARFMGHVTPTMPTPPRPRRPVDACPYCRRPSTAGQTECAGCGYVAVAPPERPLPMTPLRRMTYNRTKEGRHEFNVTTYPTLEDYWRDRPKQRI